MNRRLLAGLCACLLEFGCRGTTPGKLGVETSEQASASASPSGTPGRQLTPAAGANGPTAQAVQAGAHSLLGAQLEGQRLSWTLASAFGPLPVEIWVPPRFRAQRFGVLIAFHGRGESLKGPTRGAQGWFDDYRLLIAMDRLKLPPLNRDDFQRFVTAERLLEINQQLATDPYRDLVLVTPYLPDVLKKEQAFDSQPKLAAFIGDALVPQLQAQLPVREQFAVDGVSLGGRAALLVGFALPKLFKSIGTLQAAIDESELDGFAELGREAFMQNPDLKLRLLTSDEDYYLSVNREFSTVLVRAGVAHELRVVSGTHSYEFNRGPGAVEMLLHHQRLLR